MVTLAIAIFLVFASVTYFITEMVGARSLNRIEELQEHLLHANMEIDRLREELEKAKAPVK